MHILVLTPRPPMPPIGGDRLRIYQICRHLSRRHRVDLLSLCRDADREGRAVTGNVFENVELVELSRIRSWFNVVRGLFTRDPLQHWYFRSETFRDRLESKIGQYDALLAHLTRTGQYVDSMAWDGVRVLEMTDAMSRVYGSVGLAGGWSLKSVMYPIDADRTARYEAEACQRFDLISVVSEADREWLDCPDIVDVYSNGVDTDQYRFLGPGDSGVVGFIGNMTSEPNIDACEWFADEVFPRLEEEGVARRFRIVGNGSLSATRRLDRGRPAVNMTGRVERIADHMEDVACAVAPLRMGSGVQNKVLEYLAFGIPCVASPRAVEGLDLRDGRDLLVADGTDEFVEAVTEVLTRPELARRLAEEGRRSVDSKYSWEGPMQAYAEKIERLNSASLPG